MPCFVPLPNSRRNPVPRHGSRFLHRPRQRSMIDRCESCEGLHTLGLGALERKKEEERISMCYLGSKWHIELARGRYPLCRFSEGIRGRRDAPFCFVPPSA